MHENIYVTQKGSYKDLTDKWDITTEGSKLIFTSKDNKAFPDAVFNINEKENRAEIKGEMKQEVLGNAAIVGQSEVNELTIEGSASRNGQFTVTFNDGTSTSKVINVAKGDSKEVIAYKVSLAFKDLVNWKVTYNTGSAVVGFEAKEKAKDKNVQIFFSDYK
ncbi:hypothetical protein [Psychrobacillus sp. BL-248-WT-3]|uniref:hypothetical protein n=1 Tax=Psychrobacillus sp. BL-248-WT-3 TaxID=2725306 RepID=UPI00146D4D70|nr:hypothetical protein [Psychrobacillus sp. BL-248-WT-3]NME05777.1 hypothetical protein [Psychrobacillus sp. BL-248-WT-3]